MKFYRIMGEDVARKIADSVRGKEWATGKARTPALTGTVKRNGEMLSHEYQKAISSLISQNAAIQLDAIPLKLYPPKLSRYGVGDRYHRHTDAPWMGDVRTDLSCTLWLNYDYEGGELVIGNTKLKGRPGECVVYNCGEPHEVQEVTAGERICAITWLQSRIRDPHKRQLVTDMRRFLSHFEDDQERFVQGGRIHSALLRMWME